MKVNEGIMGTLLVLLLFGCFASISGHVVENHSVDVENMFKNFETLAKQTNNGSPAYLCVDSEGDLIGIRNSLVRKDSRVSGADISITFSSDCDNVGKWRTHVLKLANDLDILVTKPTSSYGYRSHKTSIEMKISQLKKLMDDTKKVTTGTKLEEIVKFQNDFQSHQSQMSRVLSEIESEQKLHNDANVTIAIAQLHDGNVAESVDTLVKVTDHDVQIEKVVVAAYGNGDNFDNIIHFVDRFPDALSRINGYKAIHDQLKKNNHLSDHRIWILASSLNRMPEKDSAFTEAVMADVKAIVDHNNFDGLIGFLNRDGPVGVEALEHFARAFVGAVSMEELFAFTNKLKSVRQRFYLINELILMLKATDRMYGRDMSTIVYELIKLRSVEKGKHKFWQKLIEENLPEGLRDLMFNNLCILNAETDEYLFASEPDNSELRYVYTGKAKSFNSSYYWQFHFTGNGKQLMIKNVKFDEHIFVLDEGQQRDDEHVVRSWIPGKVGASALMGDTKAEFYLDMLGAGHFLIVNKHFDQVLYAPFGEEPNLINRRPVFAKKYDRKNVPVDSKWTIGVCKLDVEYDFSKTN